MLGGKCRPVAVLPPHCGMVLPYGCGSDVHQMPSSEAWFASMHNSEG